MFIFPYEHKYAYNKFHFWDFVPAGVGSCPVLLLGATFAQNHFRENNRKKKNIFHCNNFSRGLLSSRIKLF